MSPTSRVLAAVATLALSCAVPAQMTLTCTQPCGDGSFRLQVTGCGAGAEIFNLISFDPITPTASGPIFGLNSLGSAVLLTELMSPLGTPPFHVNANAAGTYLWQFCLPPQNPVLELPADIVTVKWGSLGYGGHSNVVYINARL